MQILFYTCVMNIFIFNILTKVKYAKKMCKNIEKVICSVYNAENVYAFFFRKCIVIFAYDSIDDIKMTMSAA